MIPETRKTGRIGVAWTAGVLAMVLSAAMVQAAAFTDNYENRALNGDITSALQNPGTPYTSPITPHGTVVQDANAGNGTKVLQHYATTTPVITVFNNVISPGLSGTIQASFDLRIESGEQNMLVLWANTPAPENYAAYVGIQKFGASYFLTLFGDGGATFGQLGAGGRGLNDWYRFHLTMNINASNGTLSTYSVVVDDLTTGVNNVGSYANMNCKGAPTQLIGGEFYSSKGADSAISARFDNLMIPIPEPASLAMGLAAGALALIRRRK